MKKTAHHRHKLAQGTQVREEDFGLLFYTRTGPKLFFLNCDYLISCDYFESNKTFDEWVQKQKGFSTYAKDRIIELKNSIKQLVSKGLIIEY
jgi:putative mycofactocin binding protein MftB